MRVLLPLACVALLVAASGAFADLTPLPEGEWGSVVGGQVPLPSPPPPGDPPPWEPVEPEPIPIPEDWPVPDLGDPVADSVCSGDPEDVPDGCSTTRCAPVGGEGDIMPDDPEEPAPLVGAVLIVAARYKVCATQTGSPSLTCLEGQVVCARAQTYLPLGCDNFYAADPLNPPIFQEILEPWAWYATGCQLTELLAPNDPSVEPEPVGP